MSAPLTKDRVLAALERRYSRPEYFFFREGEFDGRRMDAWAVGCYRTNGWPILGFEVKVERADWLRELRSAAKSDPLFERSDEWYLVSPPDVAVLEEVPPAWGWITVTARGCRIARRAPRREKALVDRNTVLRCLFKLEERMIEERRAAVEEASGTADAWREEERARLRRSLEASSGEAAGELRRLQEKVHDFEQAAGFQITSWPHPRTFGAAVRLLVESRHLRVRWEEVLREAQGIAATATKVLKVLPESLPEKGGSE